MLKITVPFREAKEVVLLINAGADELYCGYLSPEWERKYTNLEFERKGGCSNFTNLNSLKKAVDLAHKRNVPVYLVLNGLYVKSQYPLLLKIIKQLQSIDFDAFIVADIGLLLTLNKERIKKQIHISTGGTVFNSAAVDFYKNFGARRIIFDRQTTIESMEDIAKKHPDMDFEAFVFFTLCTYIDGFCTFLHTYGRMPYGDISKKNSALDVFTTYDLEALTDACQLNYSVEVLDAALNRGINKKEIKPSFYKRLVDSVECGACALYDIIGTGVKSVKIVGRQLDPEERLTGTRFIRSCLNILTDNRDIKRQDFYCKVQRLYRDFFSYHKDCGGNNCFHPEIVFGRNG